MNERMNQQQDSDMFGTNVNTRLTIQILIYPTASSCQPNPESGQQNVTLDSWLQRLSQKFHLGEEQNRWADTSASAH